MRLIDLSPDLVAQDVVDTVHGYLIRLSTRLDGARTWRASEAEPDWQSTDLGLSAWTLAAYALDGTRLDAPARDYVQSICEALYVRPADGAEYSTGDLFDAAEPTTSWGLVIRAALVRESIEQGNDVRLSELALLASLTPQNLRHLASVGEIKTRKKRDDDRPGSPAALVTAAEARRWLSGRGIKGFDK